LHRCSTVTVKNVVTATPYRAALRVEEAAEACGVSRDFFDRHVLPEIRAVRKGRIVLIPVKALEDWLDANARRIFDNDHFA
jgi:excisionase family DNA binding protein